MRTGLSALGIYCLAGTSGLVGAGSLALFLAFLYFGAPGLVDFGLGETGKLAVNAGLSFAFFLQHSGMIRTGLRRRLTRWMAEPLQGSIYSIASGIVLLAVMLLWQVSEHTLVSADGPLRWLCRAIFWVAILGLLWVQAALRDFEPFGIGPMLDNLREKQPSLPSLTTQGPYGWVRHPIYFLTLVMIWANPDLTSDRLVFNLLWTGWIIVGTLLEERDLVNTYGNAYRDYQRRVCMLIPCRREKVG